MQSAEARTAYVRGKFGDSHIALGNLDPRVPYVMRTQGKSRMLSIVIGMCTNKQGLLCFNDYERGHMLEGKILANLPSGIVFETDVFDAPLVFTPLTMAEYETEIKPALNHHITDRIHDLDDLYVWYRKKANLN